MIRCFLIILSFRQFVDTIPAKRVTEWMSYEQQEIRKLKQSFGYFEDTYLNFTELATKYGYPWEQHVITTEDGYVLTVFRILSQCSEIQKYPIILGHGIFDSSDSWILTGPKTGLGYLLSNNCYDVWAVNYRGNVYSRKHIYLDPDKDVSYWNFSFDENGNYDLPAFIDYVLGKTKQPKLYYIGHSQGTTDFFVMGSLRPEYNEKIHLSIHLGPVVWMKNMRSPLPKFLSGDAKKIKSVLEYVGLNEIFGKHQLIHVLSELLCQIVPNEICGTALTFATGYRPGSIKLMDLAVLTGHLLVGTSIKTLAHFAQLVVSGEFERYDEGKKNNIIKYKSPKPTKYNMSAITSPIVLISGENDWISTLEDINILVSKLPNLIENYVVPDPTWSHNNHLWGVNASELVFPKIFEFFQTFNTR